MANRGAGLELLTSVGSELLVSIGAGLELLMSVGSELGSETECKTRDSCPIKPSVAVAVAVAVAVSDRDSAVSIGLRESAGC